MWPWRSQRAGWAVYSHSTDRGCFQMLRWKWVSARRNGVSMRSTSIFKYLRSSSLHTYSCWSWTIPNQLSWFTVTVYCRRRLWSWPNRAVLRFTCSSGVDYGVEVDSVSAHWTLRVVFSFSVRGPQSLPGANSCEGETLNGKGDSFTLCLLKNALNFFASNGGLPVCFPSVHLKSWTTF